MSVRPEEMYNYIYSDIKCSFLAHGAFQGGWVGCIEQEDSVCLFRRRP